MFLTKRRVEAAGFSAAVVFSCAAIAAVVIFICGVWNYAVALVRWLSG